MTCSLTGTLAFGLEPLAPSVSIEGSWSIAFWEVSCQGYSLQVSVNAVRGHCSEDRTVVATYLVRIHDWN